MLRVEDRGGAVVIVTALLLRVVPVMGFVSVHEGGNWPADWPSQLESYRSRARTFEIGTTVRESVYEIPFEKTDDFERIWPILLELRSPSAPLRVCSVGTPGIGRTGVLSNDSPVVRIYAPVYGSSAQKPGGRTLPIGPPWPLSVMMPDGSLPEYVVISEDGSQWVPAVGNVTGGFRHRARVEIELVADGHILDFRRILVPAGIPIVDRREMQEERKGSDWYVSPQGNPGNAGTVASPWDLASALEGRQNIQPGDTLYLLEGNYRRRPNELFDVRLQGTEGSPIRIRPAVGQRVVIDGGLAVLNPSSYVWIHDLEILVSEPLPSRPVSAGSNPADLKRPPGGLHLRGGSNCKYINLVIHNCNQGISCWKAEMNPEIYGCILYGNGWLGSDRGHGHCVYTQNDLGVKTISNCIMTCPYDGCYTMHAYGSEKASVNNYRLTENICYKKGPFLVGGASPSQGIYVHRNILYGIDMQIGYTAAYNEDCEILDNVVVNGKLETVRYRKVTWEGNLVLPSGQANRPSKNKFILLPNRYDRNRAHLAVFNWDNTGFVPVEPGRFLDEGDTVELLDPEDPFGSPVVTLVCRKGVIHVPTPQEFAVFVLRVVRR
ncbi:MAG: right-handed parallel beta-helix repeat-containing protein [Phycisphaerae bacterium]|nr:right-handed parallel beta-helix repeat-containing protein [Phycisphaerae bacterium]